MPITVIRQLTRQMPFKAICLRGSQGHAQTTEQECSQLQEHFSQVFVIDSPEAPPPLQPLATMPFTREDVLSRVRVLTKQLRRMLCLACLFEPWHRIWQIGSWPLLQQLWCSNRPFAGVEGCFALPKDIRPIALTDSLGTRILGVLAQVLRPYALPATQQMPIFAFIPNRGPKEALCRSVRSHGSSAVFVLASSHKSPSPTTQMAGGATLSLDMSQDFDRFVVRPFRFPHK